ncbi:Nonsense-mediated mRNA decay protein [Ceraceosorus bombacis]|uniref:Nonsense-mediated mRNA decay protein n=1 Tax=Ceraceosorus bombacis TaxID=401625 RepID=A0A0N7L941_9BASI|nr:Nonsense-mediated mRNA decay protein [Ceraceosorus bombacis]
MAAIAAHQADDEQAVRLGRESKTHRLTLKGLLEHQSASPTAPAIDFARKEARNSILRLLFACTFSSRAQGADVALWTETTHPLVHLYRSRLSAFEKDFKKAAAASAEDAAPTSETSSLTRKFRPSRSRDDGNVKSKSDNGPGQAQKAADYLRLAASFRDFLASEENFWRELAGRVVRVFRLEEARPHMKALGIPSDEAEWSISASGDSSTASTGMERISGTQQAQPALLRASQLPENRKRLVEMVHKALIYCGDLARYRELYREDRRGRADAPTAAPGSADAALGKMGGGRSKGVPRGGKAAIAVATAAARSHKEVSSHRDFSRAITCYEQARLLVPDKGNPSNQLAVMATYSGDTFAAVHHYYRALCVRHPFETARQNLKVTLRKAFDIWNKSGLLERLEAGDLHAVSVDETGPINERFSHASWNAVALHHFFYSRTHFLAAQRLSKQFLVDLDSTLADRVLGTDVIVRLVVTALSTSWTTRLWRTSGGGTQKKEKPKNSLPNTSGVIASPVDGVYAEHFILSHVLGLFDALVKFGTAQTREALRSQASAVGGTSNPPQDSASAARNITAAFRRTLPALRVCSKWTKSHLEYISRCSEQAAATSSQDSGSTRTASQSQEERAEADAKASAEAALVRTTPALWRTYADFANLIRFAFPFDILPKLSVMGSGGAAPLALEEDSDLRGFAPLRKATMYVNGDTPGSAIAAHDGNHASPHSSPRTARPSQVHPNDEQLMRIADLLIDAKVMAESDACPLAFDDTRRVFYVNESGPGMVGGPEVQKQTHLVSQSADAKDERNPQTGTETPTRSSSDLSASASRRIRFDERSEANSSEATEDVVDMAMRAGAGRQGSSDRRFAELAQAFPAVAVSPSPAALGFDDGSFTSKPQSRRDTVVRPVPAAAQESHQTPQNVTAQHLLLQVLTGRSPATPTGASPLRQPPTPHSAGFGQQPSQSPFDSPSGARTPLPSDSQQPQTLFGGIGDPQAGQASIWSSGGLPRSGAFSHASGPSAARNAWDAAQHSGGRERIPSGGGGAATPTFGPIGSTTNASGVAQIPSHLASAFGGQYGGLVSVPPHQGLGPSQNSTPPSAPSPQHWSNAFSTQTTGHSFASVPSHMAPSHEASRGTRHGPIGSPPASAKGTGAFDRIGQMGFHSSHQLQSGAGLHSSQDVSQAQARQDFLRTS